MDRLGGFGASEQEVGATTVVDAREGRIVGEALLSQPCRLLLPHAEARYLLHKSHC